MPLGSEEEDQMGDWRKVLHHFVDDVETEFDRLRYSLKQRLGGFDPIHIVPYIGYGNRKRIFMQGRVLEDRNITPATENDSLWDNLLNTYKRMDSDEIPFARLIVRSEGVQTEIEADEEGQFEVWVDFDEPLPEDRRWQPVTFELIGPESPEQDEVVRAEGKAFIPPPDADYGVISDIDDTVIEMDVDDLLRAARTVFLGNAHTRLPFPGVAALYRAFHAGPGEGIKQNPLFFVSSSPWNLYDLLVDFFRLHDIPNGPVLTLRNWGITKDEILPLNNRPYKTEAIRRIIDLYPDLHFILIGDSSQEDPEIYTDIAHRYPDRILAIYIRDVTNKAKRTAAVRRLEEAVVKTGNQLRLADDSLVIAKHALQHGWISDDVVPEIKKETAYDEGVPEGLEALLEEDW
jgi:phosphatidate phosphatase APP1